MNRNWFRSVLAGCLVVFFAMLSVESFASSFSAKEIYNQNSIFKTLKKSFMRKSSRKYFSRKVSCFRFYPRKTKFKFSSNLIFCLPPKIVKKKCPVLPENDGAVVNDNDTNKLEVVDGRVAIMDNEACLYNEHGQQTVVLKSDDIDFSKYDGHFVKAKGLYKDIVVMFPRVRTFYVKEIASVGSAIIKEGIIRSTEISNAGVSSAKLVDLKGNIVAVIYSKSVNFGQFEKNMVRVAGLPSLSVDSAVISLDVKEFTVTKRWREAEGILSATSSSSAVLSSNFSGFGDIRDVVANLHSDSIDFKPYNYLEVRVGGYIDRYDNSKPRMLLPDTIEVTEIKRIGELIVLNGRLSASDNDSASLYGENGYVRARLISKTVNFSGYDDCFVEVECRMLRGPVIQPVLRIDPVTGEEIPVCFNTYYVEKIKVTGKPVVMEGELVALRCHRFGDRCFGRANLLDNEGKLVARLYSKTIVFSRYDRFIVKITGTLRLSSSDKPVVDINVKEIRALRAWMSAEGRLQFIPTKGHSGHPQIGNLLDKDGRIILKLRSKTIDLSRYDKFQVWVGGYVNNSFIVCKPWSMDLKKIRIISEPPVIEKWLGIVSENNLDCAAVADCPFMLESKSGAIIGFLKGSDSITEQLKKVSHNFFVAVKGEVTVVSSQKFKKMNVDIVDVIQDLRHILWMSNKPLIFKVGEKVEFNKIGDVIRALPVKTPSVDNDSPADNDTALDNDSAKIFVYQKYWDFDDMIYPVVPMIPCPIENSSSLDAENDACSMTSCPIVCPRTKFVDYDYRYDSRIKTANIKCIDNPVFEFKKPGFYKITLTGSISDDHGVVEKVETVSRIIQVWPEFAILDPAIREMIIDTAADQNQLDESVDEMKALFDTIMEEVKK